MPEPKSTTENEKPQSETKLYNEEWMLRPCELYKEEYHDCKSIAARFHQYFVFGEYQDCTQWKIDYDNCHLWKKYNSKEAFNKLISSEKQRRIARLRGHYNNDVWQRRDKPPEDWNAPLPDWLEERAKVSYLRIASEKLKKEKEQNNIEHNNQANSCTLM